MKVEYGHITLEVWAVDYRNALSGDIYFVLRYGLVGSITL